MIGSDLEGAAFDDIIVKGDLAVVRATSTSTSQVPEQSGGGCSGT
jgi:hypothetical protein